MFDSTKVPTQILKHPELTQSLILKEYINRQNQTTDNNSVFIGHPQNGFVFLLDAFSSIVSQIVTDEDRSFENIYPLRSTTSKNLNNFLSDFDYTQLLAEPCELNVRLILNKQWVIRNAKVVDINYSQLVIPASTNVIMGDRVFSIYYPIIISINRNNNLITTYFDLSETNPLKTLKTNQLIQDYVFMQDGIEYLSLVFTTYQFEKFQSDIEPNVSENTGFVKTYNFNTGYFYAARIFSVNKNGTRNELSYTLSQTVYNTSDPTVLITLQNDNKSVTFTIPTIYFEKKLIGSSIEIELYTTEGYINEIITSDDMQNTKIRFPENTDIYSAMLNDVVDRVVVPYKQTVLDGGKSALDFEQLKSNVINGTLNYTAPITNMQLVNHVNAFGFDLTKYIDNVTDRIYYAHSTLLDSNSKIVPVVNSPVKLTVNDINGSINTIKSYSGNYITVLPSTIFRYDSINNVSYPISNAEFDRLYKLSKEELVKELNSNIYTKQPFHVVMNIDSRYPKATTYNLMNPSLDSLLFVKEHETSDIQLSVIDIKIEHLNSGIGGYKFYFYVKRSNSLKDGDPRNFMVAFVYNQSINNTLYKTAMYEGLDEATQLDVFTFTLDTSYKIDINGNILVNFDLTDQKSANIYVNITDTFKLYTCVLKENYPTLDNTYALMSELSKSLTNDYIILSQQQATISLGESLAEQIFNVVDIVWDNSVYKSYGTDIPYLQQSDVYQRYNNILVTDPTSDISKLQPFTLFKKGEEVLTLTDFNVTVSSKVKSNSSIIPVNDVSHLLVGMKITSGYISPDTYITAINETDKTITISNSTTNIVPQGHFIYISNKMVELKVLEKQKSPKEIIVEYSPDVFINYTIVGFGVTKNLFDTKDTEIDRNKIYKIEKLSDISMKLTLENDTISSVDVGNIVSVYNDKSPVMYQYLSTDVCLDSTGSPVIKTSKTNTYRIDMLQFDARLFVSEEISDVNYIKNLPTLVSSTSHRLDIVRDDMLERTYLYYKPYRTIGSANFLIGSDNITRMNLELSLELILYVPMAVLQSTQLKEVMKETVIDYLSNYFNKQKIISVTDIAKNLSNSFGNNVISIDVSGINSIFTRQTIAVDENGVSPSISYKAVLREDNTIALEPDIIITFKTI